MRKASWICHEMMLQCKNGLYVLYLFVACFYIVLMSYVPTGYKETVLSLIIFSDPTFLGMFFVGSIFLLEKTQGVPKAIGVSPLGVTSYLLGKVLSLLVISVGTTWIITLVSIGWKVNWVYLMGGVALSGSIFTLYGLILGTMMKNNNQFLIVIALVSMILALPLIYFYGIWDVKWLNFIPNYSAIAL